MPPPMQREPAASRWAATDFFDADLERRLQLPVEDGCGLPNVAYTDRSYHDFEQRTVFRNAWVFAAFAHRLPSVGDVLPVEVAGQPVVIVRGGDGRLRAFHNVCRHRGAKLVDEFQAGRKALVCPNHSWSYSLTGRLLARPHFFGGGKHDVNRADGHRSDLARIRCETWHDWVFVNVGGGAAPFDEYVAFVEERLRGYDLAALEFAGRMDFEVRANWKLAVENFIDPYHVFSCHPWLDSFVGMTERSPPGFREHVLYCGYEFKKTDPARGEGLPYFPGLPEDKKRRGDWYVLFPNFAFEIFPDQVVAFIAAPRAPDRCLETIALYFVGEGARGARYRDARERVTRNWRELNHEDIGVIERMQAGRASEGFDGGVLSPYWDPVQQQFSRLVVDAMKDLEPPGLKR